MSDKKDVDFLKFANKLQEEDFLNAFFTFEIHKLKDFLHPDGIFIEMNKSDFLEFLSLIFNEYKGCRIEHQINYSNKYRASEIVHSFLFNSNAIDVHLDVMFLFQNNLIRYIKNIDSFINQQQFDYYQLNN